MRRSGYEDLFWDRIRMQKGTAAEQVDGSRTLLRYLFKGERPRSGDGFRMVCNQPPASLKQHSSAHLIPLIIVGETALCFLDVGPGLIKCERQPTQFPADRSGSGDVSDKGMFQWSIRGDERGTAQQEQRRNVLLHSIDFDTVRQSAHCLRTCCQHDMASEHGGQELAHDRQ